MNDNTTTRFLARDEWLTSGILSGAITFAQGKLIDDMLDTVSAPSTPEKPAAVPPPSYGSGARSRSKRKRKIKTTGLGKAVATIDGQRITVARMRALELLHTGSQTQADLRSRLGFRTDLARDVLRWLINENFVEPDGIHGDLQLYRLSADGDAFLARLIMAAKP
jgi:hypothetical protein